MKNTKHHARTIGRRTWSVFDGLAEAHDVTLKWRNVCVAVGKQKILTDVSGSANPREVTSIIGHSGCGKSTLLNILSGRIKVSESLDVAHDIQINGRSITPSNPDVRHGIAFVPQSNTLNLNATARESIKFSARLRLQRDTSDVEIERITNRILRELRLESVADSLIRSLSGGEACRTSLGIEVVTNPNIVILDEVTSGLDSYNAITVVEVLKKVAAGGASVIFTVHQPSSQIFSLIDRLVLMKQGHTMYSGSTRDLPDYFAERNFEVPKNFNPADWIIYVCEKFDTPEEMKNHGFGDDSIKSECIEGFVDNEPDQMSLTTYTGPKMGLSLVGQIRLLLTRGITNMIRAKRLLILRYVLVAVGGISAAVAFAGVGDREFLSHTGAIFFALMATTVTVQVILLEFIDESPLLLHEVSMGYYRLFSYTITRIVFDLFNTGAQMLIFLLIIYWSFGLKGSFLTHYAILFTFANVCSAIGLALGSSTSDPHNAKELIPMTVLPQLLFCGYFVSLESLPSWLNWMPYLMPLTYVFRLAINNEFSSCLAFDSLQAKYTSDCADLISDLSNSPRPQSDLSTLFVPAVGLYQGTDDIDEYLSLTDPGYSNPVTIAHGYCKEKGSTQLKLNSAGESYCSMTRSAAYQFKLNTKVLSPEVDKKWLRGVILERYTLTFPSEEATVDNVAIHATLLFPPHVFDLLPQVYNNTAVAEDVCAIMQTFCPKVYLINEFQNQTHCIDVLDSLPFVTNNKHGFNVLSGNSTGCRQVHAYLATSSPDTHCQHISFIPILDTKNTVKCSDEIDFAIEDIFNKSDINQREMVAIESNIDPSKFLDHVSFDDIDRNKCARGTAEDIKSEFFHVQRQFLLPTNAYCRSFLQDQFATGESNYIYWIILLTFIVFFRSLSVLFLHRRVVQLI